MQIVKYRWRKAEKNLQKWLSQKKISDTQLQFKILQSLFFFYTNNIKEELSEQLSDLCDFSFEQIKGIDFLEENLVKESIRVYEPEDKYDSNDIQFSLTPQSEINERIVKNLLLGDRQIFIELYENDFPKIAKYILKNSGTLENARDVFQDALLILLENVIRLKPKLDCTIGTYLYSISKNLWFERLRINKKETLFSDVENVDMDSYLFSLKYETSRVYKEDYLFFRDEGKPVYFESIVELLETCSDSCKELLERFYYHNQSWEEIASAMKYTSAASARNQKYKYLEKIRKQISN